MGDSHNNVSDVTNRLVQLATPEVRLWSISALAQELKLARQTVTRRLANVEPAGRRRTHNLYRLKDAIYALLAPSDAQHKSSGPQEEPYDPETLPPDLLDKHYAAMLKKQQFERDQRHLIPAEEYRDANAQMHQRLLEVFTTFPQVAERELGATPVEVELLETLCKELRGIVTNSNVGAT